MDAASHSQWLPEALHVPGILHILDNLAHDMDVRHLKMFDAWYTSLKNVADFLCIPEHRNRFVMNCLRQSVHSSREAEKFFENSPPKLYEQRWGHIINFLNAAQKPLLICRVVFSAEAYKGPNKSACKGFDVDALVRILEANSLLCSATKTVLTAPSLAGVLLE